MKGEQLSILDKYFFRLDFGIYSRYTNAFELKKIPNIESQKVMIQLYFNAPEFMELKQKNWFTWFELCKL